MIDAVEGAGAIAAGATSGTATGAGSAAGGASGTAGEAGTGTGGFVTLMNYIDASHLPYVWNLVAATSYGVVLMAIIGVGIKLGSRYLNFFSYL